MRRLSRLLSQVEISLTKAVAHTLYNLRVRKSIITRYQYNFSVKQLIFICRCLEDTQGVDGAIVEVGCERGNTTLFLNNYLDDLRSTKTYFAIDTFRGFVRSDIDFEVKHRSKYAWMYSGYQVNSKKWFDHSLRASRANRVKSIKSDVNKFDLRSLGPLSFALVDVDLYRPIKKILPELYNALSPGGIMLIDDCNPNIYWWDGAHQAYREFMRELGFMPVMYNGKMGIIRKPLK